MDITIVSHVANACNIVFDTSLGGEVGPMLAIQWAKVVAGVADPQTYIDLFKALKSPDADALNHVREMVSYCLGAGA
jgi:hypothetical protein